MTAETECIPEPDWLATEPTARAKLAAIMAAVRRYHLVCAAPGDPLRDARMSITMAELFIGQLLLRAAADERERIAGVIEPGHLRKLADWFDTDDWFKTTMFPETWPERADEVQQDLRAWADLLTGETP
jgi:hypothetical protein